LHSIYSTISDIYVEYDDSILEEYTLLVDSVDYTKDMVLDTVVEVLLADAIGMLNMHGIIMVDDVKLSTVDALLQMVAYANRMQDTEDALSILAGDDLPLAIAELACSIADPPDFIDGYTMGHILEDIIRIEPFLQELLVKVFTKDTAEQPLSPAQVKYCAMFPNSIVAEMLQPIRLLYTGGHTDTYSRILSGVLADADTETKYIILLGIVVVSNARKDEYLSVFNELLSTHLEPDAIASISIRASQNLQELIHVTA
jgi:hypothetical protein